MNLFLTGASGFLGSHTAEELIHRGHSLTALVRKTSQTNFLKSLPLKLVEGALPEVRSLETIFEETDAVIHIAGLIKARSEAEFFKANAIGTQSLVDQVLAAKKKPKLFIYV